MIPNEKELRFWNEIKRLRDLLEDSGICPDCGGEIKIRNPTGKCDHLQYPTMKGTEG